MREKPALERAREQGLALTYDDVRLVPGESDVLPGEVATSTMFSRNVALKIPIVSAAMDTVTEYALAIELAKLGGLGVIHRSLSIEKQVSHVDKVKHHLNGLIEKPICVYDGQTVEYVLRRIEAKKYSFFSFPVINQDNKLVGIVTNNDFDFCDDHSLSIEDIMSRDLLTALEGTTIDQAYEIMRKEKKKALPLVSKDMEVRGLYVFSDVKRIVTDSGKMHNIDDKGRLRVAAAVGVGNEALRRVKSLIEKDVDVIVLDSAHGGSSNVIKTLERIKRDYKVDVVAGNVSSGVLAVRLADAGADGIKVGQGPGSICTTRVIAGIGVPQVSAVYDCARALAGSGIPICADGGLRFSGDIPVAIAAGADSVMMGSMLAGTEEAPGEKIFLEGRTWKHYRGMGSLEAMAKSKGSRERYSQENGKLVPEGIEGAVPYRGKLEDVIFQYVGGLRNGMGYVGAATIRELKEKGELIRITSAGIAESHPHDVRIIKDAPNYSRE